MKESLRTLLTKLLHFFIGSAIVWALPASFNPLSFLAAFIPSIFAPSLLIPCITAGTGIFIYSAIPDKFKKPAHVLRFLAFFSFGPLIVFGMCCYKALQRHPHDSPRARNMMFFGIALYIVANFLNPLPMPPLLSHLIFGTSFTGLFYLGCWLLIIVNAIQHSRKNCNPSSPCILDLLFNSIQSETPQEQEASQNDTIDTSKIESRLKSLLPEEASKNFETLVGPFRGIFQATQALSNMLLGSSLAQSLNKIILKKSSSPATSSECTKQQATALPRSQDGATPAAKVPCGSTI